MTHITIENKYGVILAHRGAMEESRLEWVAANQFEIRIKGSFTPLEYDAARNLALQVIIDARLPAIALKRVMRGKRPNNHLSSDTRKMF